MTIKQIKEKALKMGKVFTTEQAKMMQESLRADRKLRNREMRHYNKLDRRGL